MDNISMRLSAVHAALQLAEKTDIEFLHALIIVDEYLENGIGLISDIVNAVSEGAA